MRRNGLHLSDELLVSLLKLPYGSVIQGVVRDYETGRWNVYFLNPQKRAIPEGSPTIFGKLNEGHYSDETFFEDYVP